MDRILFRKLTIRNLRSTQKETAEMFFKDDDGKMEVDALKTLMGRKTQVQEEQEMLAMTEDLFQMVFFSFYLDDQEREHLKALEELKTEQREMSVALRAGSNQFP
jgi:hypothetical protein